MTHGLELTGPLATVVLLLPLAALVIVMAFATRKRPSVSGARRVVGRGRYGAPLVSELAGPTSPSSVSGAREPRAGAGLPGADLMARIGIVEASGEAGELPELFLALARLRLDAGRLQDASDQLRKSIRIAARLGNKEVHARARLELCDIARQSGDLTTACEHWQIARGLFHELERASELKAAETRMRQHGCPTDWVLNDF